MNPEPQRPVRCPKCGCSFEEHNVESEIMGPGAFLFVWACYNCGHKWIDYEIAKTNFAVSQKNQMHSNDDNYLILLMTYCRNIINTDRSGLAMALERVRRVAEGYSWIPHNEWGSYDHTERTTATLQKEVGHLIDEIDNIAGLALNQSGERVNVHIREVETGIAAIRNNGQRAPAITALLDDAYAFIAAIVEDGCPPGIEGHKCAHTSCAVCRKEAFSALISRRSKP